jgi:hypothetical protein
LERLASLIRGTTITVAVSSKAAANMIINLVRVFISCPPNAVKSPGSQKPETGFHPEEFALAI